MKSLKVTGIVIIVLLALALLGVGFVFAQQPTQFSWGNFGLGGMMGGYGQNGGDGGWMDAMHDWMTTGGGMHTLVWNSLAEGLGLTPEEFNARLESGQTLAQIAEAQGISQEQLAATLEVSVKTGLEQAVAEGVLTQAQAEAMLDHMDGNYAWMLAQMGSHMGSGTGFGPGGCHGNSAPQDNS